MFFFFNGVKKSLVTSGVVVSVGLFVADAIFACTIHRGYGALMMAVPGVLAIPGVVAGYRSGYLLARWIWRAVAFVCLVGALLNPLAWLDADAEGYGILRVAAIALIPVVCFSYCLCEHAKLRNVQGAQRWRSFP